MSLYFNERMKEQIEDPAKDNIIFTYPWVIEFTTDEEIDYERTFRTTYKFLTTLCMVALTNEGIKVFNAGNGSSCFVSYNMYYDDDMRFLFHSSTRTKMTKERDTLQTPDGFTAKITDAFEAEKNISRIVVIFELHLPLKWFYRPAALLLRKTGCDEYPETLENDFKFMFLKTSDYSIKCPNGSVPALKIVLNVTSGFMKKHFEKSHDNELVVEYSIDVVKPLVYYLHSMCVQMPPSYDLEYVHRLFTVIKFFEPVHINPLRAAVDKSLSLKLVEENGINFDLLLRWLSISRQYELYALSNNIVTIITEKYYFKWHDTFPENARNAENPIFRDVFGVERIEPYGFSSVIFTSVIFTKIEDAFIGSLKTNVILS